MATCTGVLLNCKANHDPQTEVRKGQVEGTHPRKAFPLTYSETPAQGTLAEATGALRLCLTPQVTPSLDYVLGKGKESYKNKRGKILNFSHLVI